MNATHHEEDGDRLAPPLSPQAYARCFGAFRQRSTEWLAMLRWCGEELPGLLPEKRSLRVLSVGPGNGAFDWRLSPILGVHYPEIKYVLVEPSPAMRRALRRRIADEPLEGVDLELHPEGFESCVDRREFDLVLLTQCLYYIPNREAALKHALRCAGEQGLVLVFHQTEKGIHQLQQRFLQRVKGGDREMFSSREIAAVLKGAGIPHRLVELESRINVTDCLVPGSREGEDVLSFFLESDYRALDAGTQEEITARLAELSEKTDGRLLLPHPVAVFLLGNGAAGSWNGLAKNRATTT